MFYETGYVADIIDLIFEKKVFVDPSPYTSALLAIPVPEDLPYERSDKEEVIASYVARFNRGLV